MPQSCQCVTRPEWFLPARCPGHSRIRPEKRCSTTYYPALSLAWPMQIVGAMLRMLRRAKQIEDAGGVALRRLESRSEPLRSPLLRGFERAPRLYEAGRQEARRQEAGLAEAAAALPFGMSFVNSRIAGMTWRDVMPEAAQSSSAAPGIGQSGRPEECPLSASSFAKPEPLPPSKE